MGIHCLICAKVCSYSVVETPIKLHKWQLSLWGILSGTSEETVELWEEWCKEERTEGHIMFVYSFALWWKLDGKTSTFRLLWIMLLSTWGYKYLFKFLLSLLSGINSEVELLDHMVFYVYSLRNNHTIFPQWLNHFIYPPQFKTLLDILDNSCHFMICLS